MNFALEGGIKGVGISESNQQANWALLKSLETLADTNGQSIYFPAGQWEFKPDLNTPSSYADPWNTDHIEWDGPTALIGDGPDSVLKFPNRDYWYLFRQRTWAGNLVLKNLRLTSGLHGRLFTANATTDQINVAAHGFPALSTNLKFTTTGTLPSPLVADTQSSVGRMAVVGPTTNLFWVAIPDNANNWNVTQKTFTDVNEGADEITIVGHGYINGDLVVLTTSAADPPAGLPELVRYFVVDVVGDDFKLEGTVGGGAIDLLDDGTGVHTLTKVVDFTDAGTGSHTLHEIGDRLWVSAGYHIGPTSGSGLDTGTDRVEVIFNGVTFDYTVPFLKAGSDSAVDVIMHNCSVYESVGVSISNFGNVTGTEGTDWMRPRVLVEGCKFVGGRATGVTPFGNHFLYSHTHIHTRVNNSHLEGSHNNAVQFQRSDLAGVTPGSQIVTSNYFLNNEQHLISGASDDDQSRLHAEGNVFQKGRVSIRADATIVGNQFIVEGASTTLSLTDDGTDDTLRDFLVNIRANTFLLREAPGSNVVVNFGRDGDHTIVFAGNFIKRDPALAASATLFFGNAGSLASDDLGQYYFHDNVYDIDGTGGINGWQLYSGKYSFEREIVDGMEQLFYSAEIGASSTVSVSNCRFSTPAATAANQRDAFVLSHSGWTLSGAGNLLGDAIYVDNPQADDLYFNFRAGRNPTSITAAATIYPDPSYNSHVVSGTTTINTINVGVTGNVQVDADATNHQDAWTGSLMLIIPSGLTFSAAGNISNGPYTSTNAEAITLVKQNDNTWLIHDVGLTP